MRDSKSILASKTFWFGAIGASLGIAGTLGWDFDLTDADRDQAAGAIAIVVTFFGVIWGRLSAKKEAKLPGQAPALLLAACLGLLLIGGCAGPQVVTPTASAVNTGANIATSTAESWETVQQGASATNVMADAAGVNKQTGGISRTMTISQGEIVIVVDDPLDGTLEGLDVTLPNGTIIKLAKFESAASKTVAAYNEQVLGALLTAQVITEQQAGVWREAINAGSATLAELVSKLVKPSP